VDDVREGRTVKVDQELLGGGANGDRASPLLVRVLVGQRLGLALDSALLHAGLDVDGERLELLDLGALNK
jgi:hypothetical protein